jgi:hypothetical protein
MTNVRYHYVTFPAGEVATAALMPKEPDSYVAEDAYTKLIREVLLLGYRWIRTDRIDGTDYAVFEKPIVNKPRKEIPKQ